MSPNTVDYGSVGPGDAITQTLGAACESDQVTCDNASPSLTLATTIYQDKIQDPLPANLVFSPQGTYHQGMGANYVQALANIAAAVKQCQSQSWVDEGETRSGEDGSHTETFCNGPQDIAIVRFNASTNGQIDSLYYSVVLDIKPANAFTWCNIAGVLGAVAGAFSGGLSAVFGIASLGCVGFGG